MLVDNETTDDTELIGSRIERLAPNTFQNQSDDDSDEVDEETVEEDDDDPVDDDGDPTGMHDHHQDDNYALGGHVTRSGSV